MGSNIPATVAWAICSPATVEVILGVLLGWAIAASVIAAFRLIRPPRVISDEQRAMQEALHAATATLPQLRRGLSADSSAKTVGHLLTLTQARAVALLDSGRVLAFAGAGVDHHDPSEWVALATQASRDDRLHVEKPHQMLGIRAARSAARCWHRSSSERSAWGRSWRCSPAAGA
jgi:LytS/YehU family sensor histidine kinase